MIRRCQANVVRLARGEHAILALAVVAALGVCAAAVAGRASAPRPSPALSGSAFQSEATRGHEQDLAANPGMLWVERGAALWAKPEGPASLACASCHGAAETSMRGVAAHYPMVHGATGQLRNIEVQVNICRVERQQASPLAWESDALLGLTAFVTGQSRGIPRKVAVEGPAAAWLERGRTLWHERQGQLDLACTQCHDDNAGKRLRGDRISQGQSDGWPAYRLEWQTLGSLHRRLRACSLGVRAEVLDYGAPDYLALELYIAWRGEGLPLTSPGIRR